MTAQSPARNPSQNSARSPVQSPAQGAAQSPAQNPAWSSRSLGSKWQHQFFYVCIRFGGWRLAYAALAVVAFFYTLYPSVRARSAPYLARRFPLAGKWGMFLHAFRLYFTFGKTLVDRAAVGITGQGRPEADPLDTPRMERLLDKEQGLMVITAHAGSWQWALSTLSFTGRRLNILYRRDAEDVDRQYFEHSAGHERPRMIDSESDFGGVIEVVAALRAGEVVCVTGDRVLGNAKNTVRVSLLGADISMPLGPFAIAAKVGTPVSVIFTPRSGPCRAKIVIARIFEETRNMDPALMAEGFAAALAEFIQREPYQFFNFYDLWAQARNKK